MKRESSHSAAATRDKAKPADISKEDALAKLLELDLARAGTASAEPAQLALADEE